MIVTLVKTEVHGKATDLLKQGEEAMLGVRYYADAMERYGPDHSLYSFVELHFRGYMKQIDIISNEFTDLIEALVCLGHEPYTKDRVVWCDSPLRITERDGRHDS